MATFPLNPRTEEQQPNPSISSLKNGGFVAIWQSNYQDGNDWGIFGQQYDANGNRIGGEFRVNTTTTDSQTRPSVATLTDGSFIVTWQSRDFGGSEEDILAQRYDANGNKIGGQFLINSTTANFQENPEITALGGGGFAIAWQSLSQDGSGYGIYAKRYNANGSAIGSEFSVNTYKTLDQSKPSIAALSNGGFAIAWHSNAQDGSEYGIYAQLYDANGLPTGRELQINTTTINSQNNPYIAALSNSGFVVAWNSYAQDGSEYGIFAQRFDINGNKIGTEFQVNTYNIGTQKSPSIATLTDGGFVVSWRSQNGGADYNVYAQRYDLNGNRVGGEFQVNNFATQDRGYSAVTGLTNGGFSVLWHSIDPSGNNYGTYARNFNASGNPVAQQYQVNTYTYNLPPLQKTTPTNPITITIAASNSNSAEIAGVPTQWRANGTNDTALINQAIAQVNAAGGGTVSLSSGTYNISDNIFLRSNVTLRGSGWSSVLRLVNQANLKFAGIIRTQGQIAGQPEDPLYIDIYNATIADLQIDGNRANQSNDSNKYGIYGNYTDSSIENVYVKDTSSYGIDPHENSGNGRATTNLNIINNRIENCGKDGITTDKVVNSLIANNVIVGNHRHGINVVTNSENNRYINNTVIGNGGNGITVQNGSRYLEIVGNQVSKNSGHGIYIDKEGGNQIRENVFSLNGRSGIVLRQASGNTVSDNLLMDNSQSTTTLYSQIDMTNDAIDYSTHNTIRGNIIRSYLPNRANYGIRERSIGDDRNTIVDNFITGATTAEYSLRGPNRTFSPSTFNLILGSINNDRLSGSANKDRLAGSGGSDTLFGGNGNDLIEGGDGFDYLYGESNHDVLWGNTGNDYLNGNDGKDYLNGDEGNDTLHGSLGDDVSDGGSGNDFIYGGAGNDTLSGGTDADVFFFNSFSEGTDIITDFSRSEGDKIRINAEGFGASSIAQLSFNSSSATLSFNGTQFVRLSNISNPSNFELSRDLLLTSVNDLSDFNSDTKSDILWRNNSTGENVVWLMNGTTFASSTYLFAVSDSNWKIAGTGDFDNDTKSDILWRNNSTGENVVWLMNGTTFASSIYLAAVSDFNWEIAATGDFNRDSNIDVVWRNNSTGENAVWLMNGALIDRVLFLNRVSDFNWTIAGTGDFNRDSNIDVVWRNNSTGENAVWLMNGTTLTQAIFFPGVSDSRWKIAAMGDFNGDKNIDLVWRNNSTGENATWLMNGTTLTQTISLPLIADLNWQIVS